MPIEGTTRLLYMIEFDADDTGSIFGGVTGMSALRAEDRLLLMWVASSARDERLTAGCLRDTWRISK